MRFGALIIATGFLLVGAPAGHAQTLYNSPNQQSTGTTPVKPLNLQQVYRQDQAAQALQQGAPYSAQSSGTGSSDFAQRAAALNQWRSQRDGQAQIEQAAGIQYMAALAESPDPKTFGVVPAAGPSSYTAPSAPAPPAVYSKKEQTGIKGPRRLFNTID